MAGRRRRASTSSVETVDKSQIRWRKETSVVKSVQKGMLSDDWPGFELQDAIVLNKDGETIENALHVGHRGPFIVKGNLIIDDPAQKANLLMRVRSSTPLEIRRCTSYSIGESEDGRPLIWVSGQGGWYEINPSQAYEATYSKMCEATTMYYNMVDIYTEDPPKKPKRGKNLSMMDELAQVFHKYAARVGDGATLEEVIERANEHSAFFIDQFSHNDGLVDNWQSTAFYKWVNTEHADLKKKIQDAAENLRLQPYASDTEHSSRDTARSRSMKSSSVEITDSKVLQPSQRPRPPSKNSPKPSEKPVQADTAPNPVVSLYVRGEQDSAADSPLQSVLHALEDMYQTMASGKKGMVYSTTISKLYFTYSFTTYKDGRVGSYKQPVQDCLHYYSRALIETLDSKYHTHEIYSELQTLATKPFRPLAYKPTDFPISFVPRKSQPRKSTASSQAPSTPMAGLQDIRHASNRQTPKPQGKCPSRTPGKSSLRPIGRTPKKRPRDEFEDETETESPNMKRSHYFGEDEPMDDPPDMETQTEIDDDDDDDDDEDEMPPDNESRSRFDVEPIKLVIRAEKVPESSPHGPDESWTCTEEGCNYIVRGGDAEECQDRIRNHFRDHEQELTRMNLAMREGARGHMPINHLLDKIKQLRGETEDKVQPIKRKLIV